MDFTIKRAGALAVGQGGQVPVTLISSAIEVGGESVWAVFSSTSSTSDKSLIRDEKTFFTLTPADFLLDKTFDESQPLVKWLGGSNGNLFTS